MNKTTGMVQWVFDSIVKSSIEVLFEDDVFVSTKLINDFLYDKRMGKIIFLGKFKIGNLIIKDKRNLEVVGEGAELYIDGSSDFGVGIELGGSIDNVSIVGFRIFGSGKEHENHKGIWGRSGAVINNLIIKNNHIENVVVGVSVNTNLSGVAENVMIHNNYIYNVIGVRSGVGYGIHFACASGINNQVHIYENTIIACCRHSIYFAKGRGGKIFSNIIVAHRIAIADGKLRAAITCLRSSDVDICGNRIFGASDGGMLIASSGFNAENIVCRDNKFFQGLNGVGSLFVGSQKPSNSISDISKLEGSPENIEIVNNLFWAFFDSSIQMKVLSAVNLVVQNNEFVVINGNRELPFIQCLCVDGILTKGGFTKKIRFSDNRFYQNEKIFKRLLKVELSCENEVENDSSSDVVGLVPDLLNNDKADHSLVYSRVSGVLIFKIDLLSNFINLIKLKVDNVRKGDYVFISDGMPQSIKVVGFSNEDKVVSLVILNSTGKALDETVSVKFTALS